MPQTINNPDIPHISAIDDGLSPGKMMRIQGATTAAAQRFNINLQCGPNVNPRDDIALHMSVRLAEGYIARNSLDNAMWGEEQAQGFNPITAGQPFEILILCDQAQYKIAVNGRHFAEFAHRIPIAKVSHLTVDGDVTIKIIKHESASAPSQNAPPPAAAGPPPQMYGPPGAPPMGPGQYGPPPMGGQPPYGAPMGGGPYGPYGPPPPPGHNPDAEKSGSGLEGFLSEAGTAIVGAFGSAVLQGALSGKQQPQTQQQPQPQPQAPPQQPLAGGYGGQSVGGLGSIGGFLTSTLASVLKPNKKKKHYKKMDKEAKKAAKKAMKYGLPAAGIGFGAYALHKGLKHHKYKHHYGRSSSSSSSSSDSD